MRHTAQAKGGGNAGVAMMIHKLVPLFALALNLLLVGSALAGDRRQHRHYAFARVALAMAVWNLAVFGLRASDGPDAALRWEYIVHVGVIPLPVFFYHYVLAFLGERRRRPALVIGYAVAAVFLAISPTRLFMNGVVETYWGYMPRSGPLYVAFVVNLYTFFVMGLVRLVRAQRSVASSFRRNRTRLVICGVSVTLFGGTFDFLRFILGWDHLYPIGIPANAVFAMALGLAIVRYRLWDVQLVAKRGLLYALMSLGLVPPVVAALYLIGRIGVAQDFAPDATVAGVIVVVFGVALPFLRRVESGVEALIFAREHGVRETLTALSRDMAALRDVEGLNRALTDGLVERVPVMHATVFLRAAHDPVAFLPSVRSVSAAAEPPRADIDALDPRLVAWLTSTRHTLTLEEIAEDAAPASGAGSIVADLEAAGISVLIPLFLDEELTTVLAVGEKLSGQVFEPAEIRLLEALMGQTAVALKNARLYQDLQLQMDALTKTQQQLVQSAKLAAVGELAASIAHELNNPLAVILGVTGLILDRADPNAPLTGRVVKVKTAAERAAKITAGLLDFARRREPKHAPVDVSALVPRALDLMQVKLRHHAIRVETSLAEGLPTIHGDDDELLQVLINLTGNAIDAMEDGGALRVTTTVDDDMVELAVSDTGTGMATEQVARMFEPFYTTKAEGKGTGLGLSVTLGIVKNHGGTITVDSVPGRGTTMRVRLPHVSVHADAV